MRLLFIPSWFPSEQNPFAGRFIEQLAVDLSSEGIEIFVLHFAYTYRKLSVLKVQKKNINSNIKVFHFSGFHVPKFNRNSQDAWVNTCLKESEKVGINWNFDLVHSHDYVGSFLGDAFSKKHDIPHVVSLHHSDFIEKKIPQWRVEILHQVLHHAKRIICPSFALSQAILTDYSVEPLTISHYIHWESVGRDQLNKPLKAIAVTSPEMVKNNKGLVRFCRAHKISVDVYGEVERSIKSANSDYIQFKGRISHHELLSKYKQYDYLISFSTVETFGLVILEALSHGLPVLLKNKVGSMDMITPQNGVYLSSEKSYDTFLRNYANFDAKEISKDIHLRFSKETVMNRYIDLYDTISKS